MPLSEEEQAILREIEDRLYESDPTLANEVRTRTVHTAVLRRIRLAALGMVAALAVTIFLLTVNFLLAFVGFLVTFALGAVIESGIRQLGQEGMGELLSQVTGIAAVRRPGASTGAETGEDS